MPSLFEWSLGVLAVYWLNILWRRWDTHVRTQRFVLDQRRKAGIPDWDHRPMAEAAADAQRRRQEALAAQLEQADDIFRVPSQPAKIPISSTARRRRAEAHTVQYNLPAAMPLVQSPVAPAPSPAARARAKRPMDEEPVPLVKRERLERRESRKRTAADLDDRRVRRRVTVVAPGDEDNSHAADDVEIDDEYDDEIEDQDQDQDQDQDTEHDQDVQAMSDEELDEYSGASDESLDAEMSDESQPEDTDEEMGDTSLSQNSRKRAADTSDDHQPGDEWEDANGLRWRIGEDGVPRRAVMIVEMRPKYRMPRDAQHPDARLRVPTYTEKYLSHEEYEEAKRKKILSWQYERARAAATTNVLPEADESVEDSLASLVSRRHGRRRPELLFDSPRKNDADDSITSVPGSDESLSFSSIGAVDRSPAIGTSRRLRLSRRTASPAPGGLLAQRYAQVFSASPARSALDEESKRRREEALMSKIREERRKSSSAAASSTSSPTAPTAMPAPSNTTSSTAAAPAASAAASSTDTKPVFSFGK
ncbi:hypothetical protein MCUN1_000465 [Malassezia cuniculi]|uniref:Uncharacterized protein n=1 Tax=Malassezia cuniculi TaxID=948313 RepID=A0AAF0EVF2_9BASI|nr:hypothetical protein MCUN1_000465 [Malassezia cuniculi]